MIRFEMTQDTKNMLATLTAAGVQASQWKEFAKVVCADYRPTLRALAEAGYSKGQIYFSYQPTFHTLYVRAREAGE